MCGLNDIILCDMNTVNNAFCSIVVDTDITAGSEYQYQLIWVWLACRENKRSSGKRIDQLFISALSGMAP